MFLGIDHPVGQLGTGFVFIFESVLGLGASKHMKTSMHSASRVSHQFHQPRCRAMMTSARRLRSSCLTASVFSGPGFGVPSGRSACLTTAKLALSCAFS